MDDIVNEAYGIAEKNNVILKGNIKISGDVNCLMFAHYCRDTLFYKDFINVSRDIFNAHRKCSKNLKEIKRIIKKAGYKKVWTKGIFSVYGDLRPLAVEAGFGQWGKDGIIKNKEYGSDFLISAIFFK